MLALFGVPLVDPAAVGQFFINLLAVGGGFLIGSWITSFGMFLLNRWLFRGKMAQVFPEVASRIGGLVLALLVALILFGSGKGGFGFGGGPGDGPSPNTGQGPAPTPTTANNPEQPAEPPVPTELVPVEQRLRVTLLSGEEVSDEKFYLIEEDRTPRNFAELVNAVKSQREKTGKPVAIEIRFTAKNPLSLGHGAVTRLINWAKQQQHTVSFPASTP